MDWARRFPVTVAYSGVTSISGSPDLLNDGDPNTYHEVRIPNGKSITWRINFDKPAPLRAIRLKMNVLAGGVYVNVTPFYVNLSGQQVSVLQMGFDYSGASIDRTFDLGTDALGVGVAAHSPGGLVGASRDIRAYVLAAYLPMAILFAEPNLSQVITTKHLGTVVAGSMLGPVPLELYNGLDIPVVLPEVRVQDAPQEDTIELSKSNNPFVPEDPITFNGTFQPDAKIGALYVRVKPNVLGQGDKRFKLVAKALPA